MPQPIAAPDAFNPISAAAISANEASTPSAVINSPIRTRRRSAPAWLATDSIFNDSTGSTQGMKFRMSPPRRATARIGNSRGASPRIGSASGVAGNSAALAPSTNVKVSFAPAMPGAPAPWIGTVRRAI